MNLRSERGDLTFGPIAGLIIIVLALVGLFAICSGDDDDDVDGLGRIELVSHRYDDGGDCDWRGDCGGQEYDQNYGSRDDRNRNRNRDRGAFSPGPFRDSPVTICLPYSCNSGGEQSGGNRENQPPPEEES